MMRRAIFLMGLAVAASAVALITLVDSRSSSTVESRRGETRPLQQTSSIEAKLNELDESPPAIMPERSGGDHQSSTVSSTVVNDRSNANLSDDESANIKPSVDEDKVRERVRERATREVQEMYSLLFEHLDLAPGEEDALRALLIEFQIAGTWTRYQRSRSFGEEERSNRIASLIGDAKLQQFLALERNLAAYGEVGAIGSLLEQNGLALTSTQRNALFDILVDLVREWHRTAATLPSDLDRGSIEYFEYKLNQRDEYERHVIELAPSVLSPDQVVPLFEQYQYGSYARAQVLETQRDRIADNPNADIQMWYPAFY